MYHQWGKAFFIPKTKMIIPFKNEIHDKPALLSIDWIVLTVAAFGLSMAVLAVGVNATDDVAHAITLQIGDVGMRTGYPVFDSTN